MEANQMKMKLNQEDEIEYSSRINLLNTGESCSCIKIQIKKKKEITMSEIYQGLQYLNWFSAYL